MKQTKMGRRKKALRELDPDERSPENSIPRKIAIHTVLITTLLNEMTSSAKRKSPRLQAQVAPLVNADTDHEASRWLDGEGDCFKKGVSYRSILENRVFLSD